MTPLLESRSEAAAILLTNGLVLVAGGFGLDLASLSTCELYDPAKNSWTPTGPLNTPWDSPLLSLLPNGGALITGGVNPVAFNAGRSDTEIYSPTDGIWKSDGRLTSERFGHTASLLTNGDLLIAGGFFYFGTSQNFVDESVETQFVSRRTPQITTINSRVALSEKVTLTGAGFLSASNNPGNFPIVQLRNLENDNTILLSPASSSDWSSTNFVSAPLANFPPGFALVTVFANGTQSSSSIIQIPAPVPMPTALGSLTYFSDGVTRFDFTNTPGAIFGVQASADLSLPFSMWPILGGVLEMSPGHFEFTDSQPAGAARFYRLRAP
jgi:hypothetical protein